MARKIPTKPFAPKPWTAGSVVDFEGREWTVWSLGAKPNSVWLYDGAEFALVKKPTAQKGREGAAHRLGGHEDATRPARLAKVLRDAVEEVLVIESYERRWTRENGYTGARERVTREVVRLHTVEGCNRGRAYPLSPWGDEAIVGRYFRPQSESHAFRMAHAAIHGEDVGYLCDCIREAVMGAEVAE